MADVRLTATNPEDSSVVPVACNSKGELLLEEPIEGPQGPQGPKGDDGDPFTGNFSGDVNFDGAATFAGSGTFNSLLTVNREETTDTILLGNLDGAQTSVINADGSAQFGGTIVTATEREGLVGGEIKIFGDYKSGLTSTGGLHLSFQGAGKRSMITAGSSNSEPPFLDFAFPYGGQDPKNEVDIQMGKNGWATFAGGKAGFTSDGELFFFSRGQRYKAVVQNGNMMADEYTEAEFLRDKLQSGATTDIDNPRQPRD